MPAGEQSRPARSVRRATRYTAAAVLLTAALLLPAGASTADGPSGGVVATQNNCELYANSYGMGYYCFVPGAIGAIPTWRALLGGRPWLPCRYYKTPYGLSPPGPPHDGAHFALKACMTNVDLDQIDGGPDIHVELSWQWVPDGTPTTVPSYMEPFWNHTGRQYPHPVISVYPTNPPRVGVPAYLQFSWFFVENGATADSPEQAIDYAGGGIHMKAEVTDITVDPGDGSAPVDCGASPKAYDPNLSPDPADQRSTCYVTYEHSSAAEPGKTYVAKVTMRWRASYQTDGGAWRPLGEFDLQAYQRIPVVEVQGVDG